MDLRLPVVERAGGVAVGGVGQALARRLASSTDSDHYLRLDRARPATAVNRG